MKSTAPLEPGKPIDPIDPFRVRQGGVPRPSKVGARPAVAPLVETGRGTRHSLSQS